MSDEQLSPTFSDWGGPYIIAATFCERVLVEQNGMSSIIRLQQRVQIPLVSSADTPVVPIQISMTLVVQLAAGTATGKQTLTITQQLPSGLIGGKQQYDVLFEQNERVVAVVLDPFVFINPAEGLHWFHIRVDGHMLTAVPLHIIYMKREQPIGR